MANASAKRTASQNESTIKYLELGLLVSTILSLILRLLFRIHSLAPTKLSFWVHILSHAPSVFITRYLVRIGTPTRGESGLLISSGEDLSRPGVIEWCFDIVYITWVSQVGSAIFGEWAWGIFAIIPLYAGWKIWTMFISPYLGFGKGSSSGPVDETTTSNTGATSKRQEKLRKRGERGDPRIRSQAVKG